MQAQTRHRLIQVGKTCLAAALLSGLVSVAAAQIAPSVPFIKVVVYALGVFVALVVLAVVSLTFSQFILRIGGTDPQWFWFPSEPKGLVQLREQAARQADTH